MAEAALTAAKISRDDFSIFYDTHFSSISVDHFAEQFLGPVEEEYIEDTEYDSLGYYEDGVKRTLTDEQIAMFRHSEIQALLRDKRHAEEAREDQYDSPSIDPAEAVKSVIDETGLEDGELEDEDTITPAVMSPTLENQNNQTKNIQKQRKQSKKSKRTQTNQKEKPKNFFRQNIKPDLRKRTWDKVDEGLGNLDYDEDTSSTARAPIQASQRRRISYDDD